MLVEIRDIISFGSRVYDVERFKNRESLRWTGESYLYEAREASKRGRETRPPFLFSRRGILLHTRLKPPSSSIYERAISHEAHMRAFRTLV